MHNSLQHHQHRFSAKQVSNLQTQLNVACVSQVAFGLVATAGTNWPGRMKTIKIATRVDESYHGGDTSTRDVTLPA
jgi:hypothetical protein